MATNNTFLAVFLGSHTSPRAQAWRALSDAERQAKQQEGFVAWRTWVDRHQAAIAGLGGPLGKTKRITERGIEDVTNEMGAFFVVQADSPAAAAAMFENPPHFTSLPGDCVEI